jgi:two-component system chemotaxis response regulator CheY
MKFFLDTLSCKRRTYILDIFIVDDDISILQLYKKFLEYFGYNIIESAHNSEEVVSKYEQLLKKPDITIMEYYMPLKNGIEATRDILKINGSAKIINIS